MPGSSPGMMKEKWRRGVHRGAIACHPGKTVRWLELHGDAGVERGFGAASAWTGNAAYSSRAGKRRGVMIEAELVLPVAVGHPYVDKVRVFRPPDRLGSVQRQTDRLGVEFDLGVEHLI